MKKIKVIVVAIMAMALLPLTASAGTVEGSIQGFTCVTQGKTCPVGSEDAMAAVESVFVVFNMDKSYYFVPNVARATMARHINDQVRVTGKVDSEKRAIHATQIDVKKNGQYVTTWRLAAQHELTQNLDAVLGKAGSDKGIPGAN